jgi:uncharacterized protein
MTIASAAPPAATPRPVTRDIMGRVLAVSGAQITVGVGATAQPGAARATVGKFLGVLSGNSTLVGMITEVGERSSREHDSNFTSVARLDVVGEIKTNAAGAPFFQRGITEYPMIGEPATVLTDRELRLIYQGADVGSSNVGTLQQVSKHFAVLGTTGVGKSSGVALILQQILEQRGPTCASS